VLVVGFVLGVAYFSVQGKLGHAVVYSVTGFAGATVILVRARRMETGRLPWVLVGAMQLLWALGDAIWAGYEVVLHRPAPYPSIADAFFLSSYVLAMAGFILYARNRAGKHASVVLRDAMMIALLVGMSAWQLVVQPYMEAAGLLIGSADIVALSYPVMDVALLAVSAALFVGPGAKATANRFLLVGVMAVLLGDGLYSFGLLNGTYQVGIWYDATWILGYTLFAAAASHPSASIGEEAESVASVARPIRFLFGIGVSTIGILTVEHLLGHDISPILLLIGGGGSFLLAVSRVATLHRQSQVQIEALVESEARYHSILDHASDAIFIVEDGRYVDVNVSACELTGYTREEILATPLGSLSPNDERALLTKGIDLARDGQKVVQERHLIHRNGSLVLVEASVRELPGGRLQSIVRDISARRTAENALRRSEELLRKVFDSGVSGISIGTADWRLLRVNQTFATMLGYEPHELEGMHLGDLTHPDEHDISRKNVQQLIDGITDEIKFEKRYLHRDGRAIWARVSLVVVRSEVGEDLVVAHVVDISKSKQLEESLRQAQMMEAVGQLAGGVAHDFNNLLSVIQNFTRFVYEDLAPTDPNRKDLEEVLKASDRGAGLVRQLLTMGQRERTAALVFDVNELLNDMSVLLKRTVPASISLTVLPGEGKPHVDMDRSQLEQILLNLTVNARDAMPSGGALDFRTEVVELSSHEARLAQVEPGEYVKLRTSDTGIGMSPDVRRRIFEPFFTTKSRGSGTGLGLATVYGIVLGAKGGITVESEVGRGTTFDIYLPSVGPSLHEAIQPQTTIRLEGEGNCILVVDDEDAVRSIVERILQRSGYRVLTAANLTEGLGIAERTDLSIRAVVTDVVMPGGSGLELVEQLRIQHPGLPALFMSGYSGEVVTAHGLSGESSYVGKPFKPDEILSALAAVIGHEHSLVRSP
jgi:PAS domain S-box-containing protein